MADRTILYVYVPGIGRDRSEELQRKIREYQFPQGTTAQVIKFSHRVKAWSWRPSRQLRKVAWDLEQSIAGWVNRYNATNIVLIGHSLGGLLGRSAWLINRGYDAPEDSPHVAVGEPQDGWAANTDRIVLLGVPNGGFELRRLTWRVLYAITTPWANFAIEQARFGGYWVSNLRLRWLQAFRDLDERRRNLDQVDEAEREAERRRVRIPYVVEILGMDDKDVIDADLRDAVYMPAHSLPAVPSTNHAGLVDLSDPKTKDERWAAIKKALFDPEAKVTIKQPDSADVCFIMHGIRASNGDAWITSTQDALKDAGWTVKAPDTKWFSALEFAIPFVRNRKSHDFLRLYGDTARDYDIRRFVFFGHSNGTYMAGKTLLEVPAIRFRRMLLAGTVLRQEFPWSEVFARHQIGEWTADGGWGHGEVHNDRAYHDFPVGTLASWIAGLGIHRQLIGPGGVLGFVDAPGEVKQHGGHMYRGGHSAAIQTDERHGTRLNEIVSYLKDGVSIDEPPVTLGKVYPAWIRFIKSRFGAWLMLVLIGLIFYAAYLTAVWLGAAPEPILIGYGVLLAVILIGSRFV